MASLAQISKSVPNGLDGWGYYLGGGSGVGDFDSARVNAPQASQFLAELHKYDPSAAFRMTGEQGGEGSGGMHYTLDYDASKLPGGDRPAMVDMNHGAFAGFRDDPNAGYAGHLFKPDATSQDAHGYGTVTSPRNMNLAADDDTGWVGKYGPMIVALIASMGAAAPALAAGEGLMSAAGSAGLGMGGNLSMGLVNGARALENGGLSAGLPSLLSMGANFAGVPSWATGAANTAYGLSQGRKPSPIGAGMSLAQIVNNVGPGG